MSKFIINTVNAEKNIRYLTLLAQKFPSTTAASVEIINLSAILNLPKGTEHFLSDVHGESESFLHVLKNGSGIIRSKIDLVFADQLKASERQSLATLIYYPEEKLKIIKQKKRGLRAWYGKTMRLLLTLVSVIASKYTRSKVRKSIPGNYVYIIEELIYGRQDDRAKEQYFEEIFNTLIDLTRVDEFICTLAKLIQRLAIDRLHIIGDIYDRGPGAHIIMDALQNHHSVDIQWGNHDILWMGAAAGSKACIANAIRISLRYGNLETLEKGYGINLLPLATFALQNYPNKPGAKFSIKLNAENKFSKTDVELLEKMHKAITVIQLKIEGKIIKKRPQYEMEDRLVLDKIDYNNGTIKLGNKEFVLNDHDFPTIDPANPYHLTNAEQEVIEKMTETFLGNEKLQQHAHFLFANGSMYLNFNNNLMYHGCIPMNNDGSFTGVWVDDTHYAGKNLIDRLERLAREAFFTKEDQDKRFYGLDAIWYLWCGAKSPLFGKTKMATFERYFIDDKSTHKEVKNPYYNFRDEESACKMILQEFGLDPDNAHIINGHVPVKVKDGESPIKANGKLLVIDGGFARAYQQETGIAGYTLVFNSWGLMLVSHKPFHSTQEAIVNESDIHSIRTVLEQAPDRIRIIDTDVGDELQKQIEDLKLLIFAFKKGLLKEK